MIPSEICFDIKLALNRCGINAATMFHDLDAVCSHINWLHKWNLLDI